MNCYFRLYDSVPVRYGSDNKKFYQTVKSGCIEEVSLVVIHLKHLYYTSDADLVLF